MPWGLMGYGKAARAADLGCRCGLAVVVQERGDGEPARASFADLNVSSRSLRQPRRVSSLAEPPLPGKRYLSSAKTQAWGLYPPLWKFMGATPRASSTPSGKGLLVGRDELSYERFTRGLGSELQLVGRQLESSRKRRHIWLVAAL